MAPGQWLPSEQLLMVLATCMGDGKHHQVSSSEAQAVTLDCGCEQEALSWARRLYPEEGKTLKVNAVEIEEPPSLLELCAGMLMPQYAARATEEALYGRRGVTITTAKGVRVPAVVAQLNVFLA